MPDHLASAQRYRDRAAKCELSAKNTSSIEFGECYRLLAQHYLVLANLEEDCARWRPASPRHVDNEPADNKPVGNKSADKPSVPSIAARMFAVRQLQAAPPTALPMAIDQMPVPEFGR
jgi:hypothetical protein